MEPIRNNQFSSPHSIKQNIASVKEESFERMLEASMDEKDKKKLLASCQQFEAIFLQMILKNMRSSVNEDGFIQKSFDREIFEGMHDEKIAQQMAEGQGIGLAQQLYKQLSKQIITENNK
ncbi:MAG: rod-binding protein [Alkaliphilus sp.]|nr:rod-binding protein [Alkaliphilus sp.]